MSVRLMAQVFETEQPPARKLMLLALADYAADDGSSIFPAIDTMAAKVSLSRRQVFRMLRLLQKDGWLEQTIPATSRQPAVYRLSVPPVSPMTPPVTPVSLGVSPTSPQGCHPRHPRGVTHVTPGVTPVSPNPSVDPSVDPSEERATARARARGTGQDIPQDFALTEAMITWARDKLGMDEPTTRYWFEEFCDAVRSGSFHHRRIQDWAATCRASLRRQVGKAVPTHVGSALTDEQQREIRELARGKP